MDEVIKAPDKFHRELEDLKAGLLKLAGMAEEALGRSLRALNDRDADLAREVIRG